MPLAVVSILLVDLDEAAVGELHAGFLEPDVLDVRRAAGGDEHDVGLELLLLAARLDRHRDGVLAGLHVRDLGAGEHGDAALLERALDFLGRVGVLEREDGRHHVDQRYLRAERIEDVGELAADRAGADDDDRLGRLLEDERFVGRDDGRLVQLEPDLRQTAHAGTGGDDDGFLRVVLLVLAVGRLDGDDVLAGERSGAL